MSMWEFIACLDGWAQSKGAKKSATGGGDGMSEDRMRDLGIEGF